MTGLPKKYAKMGFKRGWAAFRSSKSSSKSSRGGHMAKKRHSKRSSSSSGKLMNGLYKPTGIVASVALGLGAAALASKVPVSVPYKQEIAAGIVGGVPGVAAVMLLKGMTGAGSNDSDLVSGY